ncbi:MAG: DNA repair protein RecN [Polyangiaceae bacterium]|nr:DNA repair protein RecN [Polyangiaceae bacterium]
MLSYLRIRGLALLDDVALELGPGLTVLTGETGAGKSIIVDALALIRGGRGRAELIRSGADACLVDAQFELEEPLAGRVATVLGPHGSPSGEEEGPTAVAAAPQATATRSTPSDGANVTGGRALVIQRAVPRTGRGRILIDTELSTQSVLAELGEHLIDLCSQHEHQSLTRPARQLALLDDCTGNGPLLARYEAVHTAYLDARRACSALATPNHDPAGRVGYLRDQLDQLLAAAPRPGELRELRARVALLRDASAWSEFANEAREALYDGDEAISSGITLLLARLRELSSRALEREDGSTTPQPPGLVGALVAELETARAATAEAAQLASRLAADVEIEPGELQAAEERLHQLCSLERRHGDLDAVDEVIATLEQDLESLEHREARLAEAARQANELRDATLTLAAELSRARVGAAIRLGQAITRELAGLHLRSARLEVSVTRASDDEPGPRGIDRVELLFSANPGEPLGPLSRIASGGELSRVLLAIKHVAAHSLVPTDDGTQPRRRGEGRAHEPGRGAASSVATYVFDEVDAGVGGAVAAAIAQRLHEAARGSQVLCITHLPQVAAFADTHLSVQKVLRDGRTITRVAQLDPAERVEELARMLGGAEVTESARVHARQLLTDGRRSTRPDEPVPPATVAPSRPGKGGQRPIPANAAEKTSKADRAGSRTVPRDRRRAMSAA